MTERMGYWVDMSQAYRTMDPAYVESVWWSLKQIFDKGLLVQDHRVAPYCPRCGTGAVRPRARPGLRDRRRPVGLRALPGHRRPAGRARRRAAGLDDHAVDAGVQHRRRGEPRRRPTSRRAPPTARCSSSPSRCSPRCSARTPRSSARVLRPRPRAHARTRARSTWSTIPDAHYVVARRLRHDRGRHRAWCTSRPAFGADDLAVGRALRPAGRQPGHAATATSRPTSRWSAACSSRRPTRRSSPTCARAGLLFRHVPYEHSYPHCWRCHTPLIYYAQPSWYIRTTADQGRACSRRTSRPTGTPTTIKCGRYGDWLEQQHRLGAVAQPLLGHAAADLALRRDEHTHRASARSPSSASWPGQDLSDARPAPAVRRRRRAALPDVRRRRRAACPRSSTAGTTPARCRSRSGATRTPGVAEFEAAYPAAVHLRGDRPDPRLVLHADGGRHAGVRPRRRTRTSSASATSSTRRAARCPSTWATCSSRSR